MSIEYTGIIDFTIFYIKFMDSINFMDANYYIKEALGVSNSISKKLDLIDNGNTHLNIKRSPQLGKYSNP